MAYFYVKNSLGTRTTGGGLTKQGVSFTTLGASNVYPTIAHAITDGAGAGDYICVSTSHAFSTDLGGISYQCPTTGDALYIVSVDDANCDQYTKATTAQEETTHSIGAILVNGRVAFFGVYLKADQYFRTNNGGSEWFMEDGTLELSAGAGYFFHTNSTGCLWHMVNCEFIGPAGTAWMGLRQGVTIRCFGCKTTTLDNLWTWSVGTGGGGNVTFTGCDLTSITGSLFLDGGQINGDGTVEVNYIGCKLNATEPTFVTPTIYSSGVRVSLANCSGTSAAAEYQFSVTAAGGAVDDESSIYRDDSTAFSSATKISLKCATDSNATRAAPFWFDFPTMYTRLSNTATDTVRIYLTCANTLYDSDVWAEVVHADGTNKQAYNFLSTRHTDILDTNGTALGTNTESWTGGLTNKYHIDLDTSTDAGADCVPIIRVYVAKPSENIYFCPTVGLN